MHERGFTEKDWKLFRDKVPGWQEACMDRLNKEYVKLLSEDTSPSEKFWRERDADMKIVKRMAELAKKYNCKMSQIALAWQWKKGILSPIIGATKTQYLDDAARAFEVKLTVEDLAYLEELYAPHKIVGAIDKNPEQGVILMDEKK